MAPGATPASAMRLVIARGVASTGIGPAIGAAGAWGWRSSALPAFNGTRVDPDARWCLEQYFAELDDRFDAGFDPALSIPADAHELVPPAGAFFIARLRERPVGCGALKLHRDAPAELKRMWIAPAARGLGVGRRLLQELERHAREAGAAVLRLETNHALTEAIALYRRSGYLEVDAFNDEPYAHHWFEKRLSRNHRRRRSVARTAE